MSEKRDRQATDQAGRDRDLFENANGDVGSERGSEREREETREINI